MYVRTCGPLPTRCGQEDRAESRIQTVGQEAERAGPGARKRGLKNMVSQEGTAYLLFSLKFCFNAEVRQGLGVEKPNEGKQGV
jgi:hypothetical protein